MASSLKRQFVEAAWPSPKEATPEEPGPQLTDVSLAATPVGLGWRGRLENFKDSDVLAVIWYKYEGAWDIWTTLPNFSGRVQASDMSVDAEGTASEFQSSLAVTNDRGCTQAGDYRAEFYLNGKRLDIDSHKPLGPTSMTANSFRDLNIALCHPSDWNRWRSAQKLDDFMAGGYVSLDRSEGVFALNYYFPRAKLDESAKKQLVERSLWYLTLHSMLPSERFSSEPSFCPVSPADQTVVGAKSEDGSARILARVWASQDGMVHVGVVTLQLGEASAMEVNGDLGPDSPACSALQSMREVYGQP
jgi:hypothetical protein